MQHNYKWILSVVFHVSLVSILSFIFVWLWNQEVITEHTQVPWSVNTFMNAYLSVNGVYLWIFISIALLFAHKLSPPTKAIRRNLRRLFYVALAFLSGKFYAFSALFFAIAYLSNYVEPISDFDGAIQFGVLSLVLGLIMWFGGRVILLNRFGA